MKINQEARSRQRLLGTDAVRQARLPVCVDGYGLTSYSGISGVTYVGCHALVLGKAFVALSDGGLAPLLENLPSRSIPAAVVNELKKCPEIAQTSQLGEAIDGSWTTLALRQEPDGRRVGTLLTEAGAVEHRGEEHAV